MKNAIIKNNEDHQVELLLAKIYLIEERAKQENMTITTADAIEILKTAYIQGIYEAFEFNQFNVWINK